MHLAVVNVLHCCAVITDEEHKACFDNNVQSISCGANRERCARELYGYYSPFTSYGLYKFTSCITHSLYSYPHKESPEHCQIFLFYHFRARFIKFSCGNAPNGIKNRPSNHRTFYFTSSMINELF